jgi:hypothetical protein
MGSVLESVLYKATERLIGYLPNLLAGFALIAIGWVLGWLAKRVVVQICIVFRFDRLFRRFRWGGAFSKADVRYAFFNTIGNVAFLVVFVALLKTAVDAFQLTGLSAILERGVLFVPKLAIGSAVAGFGWLLGGWVAVSVRRTLRKEDIPRASLIARFAKAVVVLFFFAMALAELDLSREIVVIGFTVTIITLGILTVVLAIAGGTTFVSRVFERGEE